jgi:DNA invertase Pin-like site-specific DNA recombinase
MRAVLYTCLASALPQEVEAELAECERIALAAGCRIAGHVHDQSPDRNGLDRLLNTARSEGVDALVITSIDRFSLDPIRLRQIIQRLKLAGIRIITPHPTLDYAYQRIRDALMTRWDSDGASDKVNVADDCNPRED